MLIAKRFLRGAGNDGSDKQPGDPVPEAYEWQNLAAYISAGHLVEDGVQPAAPAQSEAPPAEPAPQQRATPPPVVPSSPAPQSTPNHSTKRGKKK